jgi:alpha-tubulin suppressor-like RCC1 family protein
VTQNLRPAQVLPPDAKSTSPSAEAGANAAAGFVHSLALKGDGTVNCWGCNVPTRGQCRWGGGDSVSSKVVHEVADDDALVLAKAESTD